MTRPLAVTLVLKESRGLAFAWFACAATMVLTSALTTSGWGSQWRTLGTAAYLVGAAALGAMSVGHEYSHRTLPLLLAQPVRRERVFIIKVAVLALLLLSLRLIAESAVLWRFGRAGSLDREFGVIFVWLPIIWGLTVAPWLTMLSRNPIAGTVFAIGIPGMLLTIGELLGVMRYGSDAAADIDRLRLSVFWIGTLVLCVAAAVLAPRTFMRLEAIEGRGADVHLPQWLRAIFARFAGARVASTQHPVWLLIKKELHLQQMAFAVGALYLLGVAAGVYTAYVRETSAQAVAPVSAIYGVLIALFIGGMASAEERQQGTLDWQVMLPMSSRAQFAVKAGMAFVLSLLLGFALPVVAILLIPDSMLAATAMPMPLLSDMLVIGAAMTAGGLYVSSVSSSGIQALLAAAAVGPLVSVYIQLVVRPLVGAAAGRVWEMSGRVPGRELFFTRAYAENAVMSTLIAVFVVACVWFAMVNHRSVDRGITRIAQQVAVVGGLLATAGLLMGIAVGLMP